MGVDLNGEEPVARLEEERYRGLADYFAVGYINGPVAHVVARLGFRQAMLSMRKDQPAFLRVASEILKEAAGKVRLARKNGLSAILIADDIASNRGLLFSSKDFAVVVLPLYRQLAWTIKSEGLYAFFHCDGDTRGILEPLIEAGYDCIHPIDNQAGLDLYTLKKDVEKRITLMGHVDIIGWDEGRIAREVLQAEEAFKEGGLILGSAGGLSMRTAGHRFAALYPQWKMRRQEDETP